jgi:hypothetical protein
LATHIRTRVKITKNDKRSSLPLNKINCKNLYGTNLRTRIIKLFTPVIDYV